MYGTLLTATHIFQPSWGAVFCIHCIMDEGTLTLIRMAKDKKVFAFFKGLML
jgi:hypothetical protein